MHVRSETLSWLRSNTVFYQMQAVMGNYQYMISSINVMSSFVDKGISAMCML